MRIFKFKKEEGVWYIQLKYWFGPKWCLALVCGADQLLDKLSEGKNEVKLEVDTDFYNKDFSTAPSTLERQRILGLFNGAVYKIFNQFHKTNYHIFDNNELWLCFVTLFVFGHYPKLIYYNVVEDVQTKTQTNRIIL